MTDHQPCDDCDGAFAAEFKIFLRGGREVIYACRACRDRRNSTTQRGRVSWRKL